MSHENDATVVQPAEFAFTEANLAEARRIIARYPEGRQASAVIPLLYLVQDQIGWVPVVAMNVVAELLSLPPIRVYEVGTFYTMFSLRPSGKYLLQVCTTTPCWLRGSDAVVEACRKKLGIEVGGVTEDGMFGLTEVECLGACVNAPMIQVSNGDFYEDLDGPLMEQLIDALRRGEPPPKGSMTRKHTSAPAGGLTSLTTLRYEGDSDAA